MESYNKQYHSSVNPVAVTAGKLFFQPKLTINNPNDKYEREADTMADKVMRMKQPGIQLQSSPITTVQKKCTHCEEEENKLQRKENNKEEITVDESVENYVSSLGSSGQPLPTEVRNFYEPRFGYDFNKVKIHTGNVAAKSAQSVNALAYTSGYNIVFNNGQYSPNTDTGKKLLGHELTHVVQQRTGVSGLQREELTAAQRIDECVKLPVKQPEDLLQGHVGLLTHIDRSLMLEEMFGAELPAITAKIAGDAAARKFICEYGISGMAALVETQKKDGAFDITAAKTAVDNSIKTKSGKFNRKALGGWRVAAEREKDIKEDAASVGAWAKDEDRRKDDIPNPSAALNMPAPQVAEITQMISNVELLQLHYSSSSGTQLTNAKKKLDEVVKIFKDLIPGGIIRDSFASDVSTSMDTASIAIEAFDNFLLIIAAGRLNLNSINASVITVKTAISDIKKLAIDQLKKIVKSEAPDYSDLKDLARQTRTTTLKKLTEQFDATKTTIEKFAAQIPPLLFILKYFRALNDSKSTAPGEKEMNDFNGKLDSLDLSLFFGSGPVNPGLEIMASAVDFIKKQIAVRLQMKTATANLPELIPSLTEVEAYFTTMNNKTTDNATVRKAYENFAQAYFQHRGEAITMQDLNISGITDVFSMPVSITGSRTIVCGAYAQMGSALTSRAGATKRIFTIAVRASKEQVESGEIDAGHAIVEVTRQSGTFFISNYLTANTEAEAMDVAWDHPEFPMHKASSSSYTDAVTKLSEQLAKLRKP